MKGVDIEIVGGKIEYSEDKRIKVNKYLQANENLFVIGDAAYLELENQKGLRRAVQFALGQARCLAENLQRRWQRRELQPYFPKDKGYVLALANGKVISKVLDFYSHSKIWRFAHYINLLAYCPGIINKIQLFKKLFFFNYK